MIIGAILAITAAFMYLLILGSAALEDKEREDEEQAAYLKLWCERRNKNHRN